MASATWARWKWSKGLGRWHRLFTDGDLTKTACGSARKSDKHVADTTAAKPSSGPICPVCEALDMLLDAVLTGKLTHAVSDKSIPAPVAPVAVPDPVAVPAGVCICGAALCNIDPRARDIRDAMKARDAALKAANLAAFDAYLADKGRDKVGAA